MWVLPKITKYQLLKALEPFDDEIEIICIDKEHKYLFVPNVYYSLGINGEGRLVFGQVKPDGKAIELKV